MICEIEVRGRHWEDITNNILGKSFTLKPAHSNDKAANRGWVHFQFQICIK